ncbi:hypothetical protein ACIA8K_03875 [Catenuloplanes sp. NPDC051500]|uniref:hypothetical protein n=1 Tax=Catenuloplanes sp. NPDC051500 TaxID=3363959 RepID=UPI0037B1D6B0
MSTLDFRILARVAVAVVAMAGALAAGGPAIAGKPAAFGPAVAGKTAAVAEAVSPTITPAARRTYIVDFGESHSCPAGNLCLSVLDPTVGKFKIFELYDCNRYDLHNFYDNGFWSNRQTGNVRSYFYDQNGTVLATFSSTDPMPRDGSQNWSPVWSVRNC